MSISVEQLVSDVLLLRGRLQELEAKTNDLINAVDEDNLRLRRELSELRLRYMRHRHCNVVNTAPDGQTQTFIRLVDTE